MHQWSAMHLKLAVCQKNAKKKFSNMVIFRKGALFEKLPFLETLFFLNFSDRWPTPGALPYLKTCIKKKKNTTKNDSHKKSTNNTQKATYHS